MKKKTRTKAKTRAARKSKGPIPTITLDRARIIVADCCWTPSRLTSEAMLKAGAKSVGEATLTTPAVFEFPDEVKARSLFERAFNTDTDEFGLDLLPDEIQWVDAVGMAGLAKDVVGALK